MADWARIGRRRRCPADDSADLAADVVWAAVAVREAAGGSRWDADAPCTDSVASGEAVDRCRRDSPAIPTRSTGICNVAKYCDSWNHWAFPMRPLLIDSIYVISLHILGDSWIMATLEISSWRFRFAIARSELLNARSSFHRERFWVLNVNEPVRVNAWNAPTTLDNKSTYTDNNSKRIMLNRKWSRIDSDERDQPSSFYSKSLLRNSHSK